MTGAVVKGLLLLLCGVALAALVVLFRLCRFLRRQWEENRRLRHDLRHYLRIHNGRYLSSKGAGRTGVGLETVREVARRHGGSCSFSACEGQFRAHVFLPTDPAAGCAKTAQAAPSDSGGSGRSASLPLGCWTVCATPLPPR